MKLKKYEAAVVLVTLCCLCFTGGFFAGRRNGAGRIVVQTAAAAAGSAADSGVSPAQTDSGGSAQADPAASSASEPDGTSGAQSGEEAGLVNINTADKETLETLPGIGEALAQGILDYRTEHGAFATAEDILNVPGIGSGRFAQIRARITV